jgi:hypothetical protein
MTTYYFYIATILFPTVAALIPYHKLISNIIVIIIVSNIFYISFLFEDGPDYAELKRICSNSDELSGVGRMIFDPGFLYMCDHLPYEIVHILANVLFCVGIFCLLVNNPGAYLLLPAYSLFFILWNMGNYTRTALAAATLMIGIGFFKNNLRVLFILTAPLFHKSFIIFLLLLPKIRLLVIFCSPLIIYIIYPRLKIYHDGSVAASSGYFLVLASLMFPLFMNFVIRKNISNFIILLSTTAFFLVVGLFYSAFVGRVAMILFPMLALNDFHYKIGFNRQIVSLVFGLFYTLMFWLWIQYSDFSEFFFG